MMIVHRLSASAGRCSVFGRNLLAFFLFASICTACPEGSTSCCNDVEGLCDLPVNDIMFGMVHNAMSSPSHGFVVFPNHNNDPIVDSLDAGYRGLALDFCKCGGELTFCHGGSQVGCGVGSRDPVETFQLINEWIDENPDNVLMIWLQINEEAGGSISLAEIDDLVQTVPTTNGVTSFADRLYNRDRYEDSEWPTLQELIDTKQQILFFYQGGPDGADEHPPGIHYFYEYGLSTPWAYTSVANLRNSYNNGCPIDRRSSNRDDFFMMNAFVTAKFFGVPVMPKQNAAKQINTATFLAPLVEQCESSIGQTANIVAVDFWDSGDMASFVNAHNAALVPVRRDYPFLETSPPSREKQRRKQDKSGIKRMKDSYFGG